MDSEISSPNSRKPANEVQPHSPTAVNKFTSAFKDILDKYYCLPTYTLPSERLHPESFSHKHCVGLFPRIRVECLPNKTWWGFKILYVLNEIWCVYIYLT